MAMTFEAEAEAEAEAEVEAGGEGMWLAEPAAAVRDDLAACNRAAAPYGLSLTREQAQVLAERRREALSAAGRVEFGRGVLRDLVAAFGGSPYVGQELFAEVLAGVQDIFYRRKEQAEASGGIADDDLADALRHAFDEQAHGDTSLLDDVPLAELRAWVRERDLGGFDEATGHGLGEAGERDLGGLFDAGLGPACGSGKTGWKGEAYGLGGEGADGWWGEGRSGGGRAGSAAVVGYGDPAGGGYGGCGWDPAHGGGRPGEEGDAACSGLGRELGRLRGRRL